MKIDIARISLDGLDVSEDWDFHQANLDRDDLKFISGLKVNARLIKTVNVVSAEVNVSSKIMSLCSRCLKEDEKDFSKAFKFNYEIKKEDRFIDLEPDIREEIILSYPVKILCQPDCKGLCPSCGKDLNLGMCSCKS